MTSQKVDQVWETPPPEQIVELTKAHVAAMEASDDDLIWKQVGMDHILIETVGRKSGRVHKVALPVWFDAGGHRIVVASFAGATKHPSWFVNLRDPEANPQVRCRVQGAQFFSKPQVLSEPERSQVWASLVADRAWYDDYQAKTERRIPLVRLPITEPIDT